MFLNLQSKPHELAWQTKGIWHCAFDDFEVLVNNARRQITENEHTFLVAETNGTCPLCSNELLYQKKKAKHKKYEVAHIYPLNPTDEEIELLKNEARLSEDVNSTDNLIPLCAGCHITYDKPRTVEEYRVLCRIKKQLAAARMEVQIWNSYPLKGELDMVITALCESGDNDDASQELSYIVMTIDDKTKGKIEGLIRKRIKENVDQYYQHIAMAFGQIDRESPGLPELIANQVRTYYLDQAQRGISYSDIFNNMSRWIQIKTKTSSAAASEIIVSYFIQNCEIFP